MRVHPTLRRGMIYLLPLAVLSVTVGLRIVAPDLLDRLSLICFDLYQRAAPRETGDAPIRIVAIDENSLVKFGQWPWPRTIVAKLIGRLREAGAAVIAFDIDFAEPDRTSPKMLLPLIAENGIGAEESERFFGALPDPDQQLAEAMHTVPIVTGFILDGHGEARPPASKAAFGFAGDDPLAHVEGFPGAIANLPVLEEGERISKPISRLGSYCSPGSADLEAW